jgi:hypothetical protein
VLFKGLKAFKGIYIKGLKELYEAGDLKFPGNTTKYGTSAGFKGLIKIIRKKKWSGYAKSPCSCPDDESLEMMMQRPPLAQSEDRRYKTHSKNKRIRPSASVTTTVFKNGH